jgi:hypothetical protein
VIPSKVTKPGSKIRFKAKLFRPAESAKADSWNFLILPKNASAKLPSRGMTAIEGTLNGFPFQATLEPDGQKSHWLKVNRKLSKSASADAGDIVTLEITPAGKDTEPEVPTDLRKALAADPKARALWSDITPSARPGLDPLDHLPQAARDARAPDQKCVLDAHCREATRLLLRPVWVLQ